MGSFIVFGSLLYWAYFYTWGFVMNWQRGRLLETCVLVFSIMPNFVSFIEFWYVLKLLLKIKLKTQSLLKKSSRKTHFQHFFNMLFSRACIRVPPSPCTLSFSCSLLRLCSLVLGSCFYVIGISYNKTQFTCLLSIINFHMVRITCLLSAFRKNRYEANQNSQSSFMLWFLGTSCF